MRILVLTSNRDRLAALRSLLPRSWALTEDAEQDTDAVLLDSPEPSEALPALGRALSRRRPVIVLTDSGDVDPLRVAGAAGVLPTQPDAEGLRSALSLALWPPRADELLDLSRAGGGLAVTTPIGSLRWCNPAAGSLLAGAGVHLGDDLPFELRASPGERRQAVQLRDGAESTWAIRVSHGTWSGAAAWFVALRDASKEAELEAKLRSTDAVTLMGRLSAGVAHDFNNLLTHVLGHADLLRQELAGDPAALERVAAIREAARQGSRMTRRLSTFAQSQLGRPRPIDLNQRLAHFEGWMRRRAGEGTRFDLRTVPGPLPVLADPVHIEQVLDNLLTNAADAIGPEGSVWVRSGLSVPPGRSGTAMPFVEVEDDGHGMDAETLARAREPLFTTKSEGRGMGLGLSVIEGLTRNLGGALRLQSEPGEGTRVTVWLPAPDLPRSFASNPPAQLATFGGGRTRLVLVVDDDRTIRRLLSQALAGEGAEVVSASDGQEALERVAELDRPPDLLVSDIVMPRVNGRDLAERLRLRWPSLPVLFVSGYTEQILDVSDGLGPNDHFLAKPFGVRKFLYQVRGLLGAGSNIAGD